MPTINIEELYVKEIVKTTKDKDDGVQVQHKAVLEKIGSSDLKVVITSDEPIKLTQGEKGLTLDIMSTQTKLPMPGEEKKGKK